MLAIEALLRDVRRTENGTSQISVTAVIGEDDWERDSQRNCIFLPVDPSHYTQRNHSRTSRILMQLLKEEEIESALLSMSK
jgi:hypothetical protein